MTTPQRSRKFAVCIASDGAEDLQVRKLYRMLPDKEAAREDYLRVVDDSGEDYLYPARRFVVVEVAPSIARKLLSAGPRTPKGR